MRDHILGSEKLAPFLSTHCPYVFIFQSFLRFLWFRGQQSLVQSSILQFQIFECFKMVMRDHILRSEQVAPLLSTNLKPASGLELHFKFPFCLLLDSVVNRKELKFSPDFSYSSGSSYLQTFMPASSLWIVFPIPLDFLAWSLEHFPSNNLGSV